MHLFVGNAAWIDFLNTEPAGPDGEPIDLLDGPEALADWAAAAGLAAPGTLPADDPLLGRARRLRAVLRAAAEALLAGREPSAVTIAAVNEALAHHASVPRLDRTPEGWRLAQHPTAAPSCALLGRLASDFAAALAAGCGRDLRRCERTGCRLLFVDTSKNRRRRWCSMELCGNREKAAGRRARARR